ncbi:MAG: hypothetical protein QGH23_02330 [Dehalococcoidia bacterium]|nr:hypothetical protein [Dehalococcoidia bacterium]MDP6783226.1 hypothetical protein [Dehalococcoidia bacterium]
MRLLLIGALAAALAYLFWLLRAPSRKDPELPLQLPTGEIELVCPACGRDKWQVRGRLSPNKTLVLQCTACSRTITFQGDMERVDHHPSHPNNEG